MPLRKIEREADSPKLLKTIKRKASMESLEGVEVLAKPEYCMEFMETLEPPKNCGHGVSACLPSRCAVRVESACNIVRCLGN